jgi:hypothetical protein
MVSRVSLVRTEGGEALDISLGLVRHLYGWLFLLMFVAR